MDLTLQHSKSEKHKAKETKPDNRAAQLKSSTASARLQIKANGKGKQESWTVKTTTKPSTKGSKHTSFRVRVSDVGFRVCLVYYDDLGKRREPYLCYLSSREWQKAKLGSLANFATLVSNKLTERAAREEGNTEKFEKLSGKIRLLL